MSGLNFAGEFSLKEMKLLTSSGAVIDIRKMKFGTGSII